MLKKNMKLLILFAVIITTLTAVFSGMRNSAAYSRHVAAPLTKFPYVQGNRILNSSGQPFYLRGAEIESDLDNMAPWPSAPHITDVLNSTVFNAMALQWKMNALRLPLSNWIYSKYTAKYMQLLDQIVNEANTAGIYVVLNLHDDGRAGSPYGDLADLPKTQDNDFWKAFALHYKANPMVIFDLYNEPKDTSWYQWAHGGGTVDGATVVGHQDLVTTIRSVGAPQIVIAEPGLSGGKQTGWSTIGTNTINDPNVMYSLHVYDYIANPPPQQDALWGPILNHYPIFYGEWALLPNGYSIPGYAHCKHIVPSQADQDTINFLNYMGSRQGNWTAWDFEPDHLVQNLKNFAPTTLDIPWRCGDSSSHAGMGTLVKNYLAGGQ